MITSRNRCDDLRRTLERLQKLSPAPLEIIVTLDGSTDGSREMVEASFPQVKLINNKNGIGSIPSRNGMIRIAKGNFILSLDDDSYPDVDQDDFIAKAECFFDEDENLAVLTFPQRSEEFPDSLTQKDFGLSQWVGTYSSSGAMLRRDIYMELPGYPACFEHAYEEPDYGVQIVAFQKKLRLETSLLIRHHYSDVNRNEIRTHHLHSRNEFWSLWLRAPIIFALVLSNYRAISQFRYAIKRGWQWIKREPEWWIPAIIGWPSILSHRKAVPASAYIKWMKLMRNPLPVTTCIDEPQKVTSPGP